MYVYLFTWHNLKTSWARCSVTNVTLVGQLHHHTYKCRTSDWAVVFDTLEERTGWSWSKMFTITALIKQEKESTAWFSLIRIHPSVQNAQLHLVCWYMPHCFMWRWSNQVVIGVDESFHFLPSWLHIFLSSSVFDYYPISSCLSVIPDLALSLAGFTESLVCPRQEDSIIFQQVIWKFVLVFNSIRKHSESCIHNLGKSQFAFPRCWIPLMYFLSLSAIHSISLKLPVDLEIVHCTWCSLSVSHPLTWDVLSDLELAWIHTTHTYIHAHVHTHTPLLTSEVDDHPWEVIIKDLMLG